MQKEDTKRDRIEVPQLSLVLVLERLPSTTHVFAQTVITLTMGSRARNRRQRPKFTFDPAISTFPDRHRMHRLPHREPGAAAARFIDPNEPTPGDLHPAHFPSTTSSVPPERPIAHPPPPPPPPDTPGPGPRDA